MSLLWLAIIFGVLALGFALCGFRTAAGVAAGISKFLFVIVLVLFLVMLLLFIL
ncbi:MAG: DUF1328 domain-containing protein [Chloroflexi bacterium]|nr:DUF1328 domain-containing protein [Chloroflexota bacterium]